MNKNHWQDVKTAPEGRKVECLLSGSDAEPFNVVAECTFIDGYWLYGDADGPTDLFVEIGMEGDSRDVLKWREISGGFPA